MAENKLRKRTDRFVIVPSTTIRNTQMSFRARGLLSFVLDLPDGWDVRSEWLATQGTEGREAIRTVLRELAEHGHYRLERRRLRSGQFEMATSISDHPVPAWAAESAEFGLKAVPMVEQPDGSFLVKHKDGTLTDDGFPKPSESADEGQRHDQGKDGVSAGQTEDGFPGPGKPGSGSPGPGKPDAGFLGPISNTETQNREGFSSELPPTSGAPLPGQLDLVEAVEQLPAAEPKARPQRRAKPKAPTKAQAERTPEQQAAFDAADRLAHGWWDVKCPELGIPVIAKGNRSPKAGFPGFRDSLQRALEAGCSEIEIKQALLDCETAWPAVTALTNAVKKRRGKGSAQHTNSNRASNKHHEAGTAEALLGAFK